MSSNTNDGDVETLPPDELDEATLQILDIRTRLRQQRRRMIRTFSLVFIIVGVSLFAGLAFSGQEGKENADEQKQIEEEIAENGGAAGGGGQTTGIADLLPPPPADISIVCALENLEDFMGIAQCEHECEISDCCEVPIGFALSCLAGNEQVCQEYAQYCDILHSLPSAGYIPQVDEATLPPEELKIEIDTSCIGLERDQLLHSPCMDMCEKGFCCFDGSGDCEVNCQVYLNCADAYAVYQNGPPAAAPTFQDEVAEACADYPDSGASNCEEKCAPSVCCFSHYCTPPMGIDCQAYAACFVLHEQDDGATYDEDLSDEIHEACYTSNIVEAASNSQCTSLCAAGSCCFDSEECDENVVNCATYAECNILHPKFVVVTNGEVEQACQSAASASAGGLCEQICHLEVMQCCFHQVENGDACSHDALLHPESVFCNIYESCRTLGTSSETLRNSHKDELNQVCGDPTTRSQCIQLCSAATCCFATEAQDECATNSRSIACNDYQACSVLYEE
jgi:hypothetical protein